MTCSTFFTVNIVMQKQNKINAELRESCENSYYLNAFCCTGNTNLNLSEL